MADEIDLPEVHAMEMKRLVLYAVAAVALSSATARAEGELRVRAKVAEPAIEVKDAQLGALTITCQSGAPIRVIRGIVITLKVVGTSTAEAAVTCDRRGTSQTSSSDQKEWEQKQSVGVVVAEIDRERLPDGWSAKAKESDRCEIVHAKGSVLSAAQSAALVVSLYGEKLAEDSDLNLAQDKKKPRGGN